MPIAVSALHAPMVVRLAFVAAPPQPDAESVKPSEKMAVGDAGSLPPLP